MTGRKLRTKKSRNQEGSPKFLCKNVLDRYDSFSRVTDLDAAETPGIEHAEGLPDP
jgi:hypothetical protein